jgi:Rrf2 family protein
MFRISRRLDYGLNLMIALAAAPDDAPRPTAFLSEKLEIPLPFLHQIGHSLMQAGLVKASPGPHGGLRLNQPSNAISILNIIEILEGSICVNPGDNNSKDRTSENCPTSFVWDDLQKSITIQLASITIEKLVEKAKTDPQFGFAFKRIP